MTGKTHPLLELYEEHFTGIQGTDPKRDMNLMEEYLDMALPTVGIHADVFKWEGYTICDCCGVDLIEDHPMNNYLYDAKTLNGQWAVMCGECWYSAGDAHHRLGTGWGQKYQKQENGEFLKVEG